MYPPSAAKHYNPFFSMPSGPRDAISKQHTINFVFQQTVLCNRVCPAALYELVVVKSGYLPRVNKARPFII